MAVLLTFLALTAFGAVALVAAFGAAGADRRLEELGDTVGPTGEPWNTDEAGRAW